MTAPDNYANGTNATAANADMSVGLPSGHARGDLLIMALECARGDTQATPTDWTAFVDNPILTTTTGTGPNRLYLFAKRDNGSETDPTATATSDHHIAKILGIRNAGGTDADPWSAVNVYITGNGASTASPTATQVTTTVADCLVLTVISNGTDSGTAQYSAWTNATLAAFGQTLSNNTGLGDGGGIGAATGTKATAGATGATGATLASASKYAFATLAIKPGMYGPATFAGAASASAATGSQTITGTATFDAAAASTAASGDAGLNLTGTATFAGAAAATLGAAAEVFTGTAAFTGAAAATAATGTEAATGTGAFATQPAAFAATGTETITGTGTFAAAAPTFVAGVTTLTGLAAFATEPAAFAAAGTLAIVGTAGFATAAAAMDASGEEAILGTATFDAEAASFQAYGGGLGTGVRGPTRVSGQTSRNAIAAGVGSRNSTQETV